MERHHISLEDWAKLNEASTKQMVESAADILLQSNMILEDMGYYLPLERPSRFDRIRRWIAERLAKLAFKISPEVRDDYY